MGSTTSPPGSLYVSNCPARKRGKHLAGVPVGLCEVETVSLPLACAFARTATRRAGGQQSFGFQSFMRASVRDPVRMKEGVLALLAVQG